MDKIKLWFIIIVLILVGCIYYMYNQLIKERAKNSVSDTETKSEVLENRFKDAVDKEKELANKPVTPSNEDADKFWDRILK